MATESTLENTSLTNFRLNGPKGRLRSTWRLMRHPYEYYDKWQKQFGKTFLIKALNGNVVATSNTENIRRVFAAKHDEVAQFAIGTITPLIGENSVLIVEGQKHKRARNLLTPPFRGESLRNSIATMATIAERVSAGWKSGDRINVMDHSLEYSLDVIIEVVFGVQDFAKIQQFKQAIKDYVKSFRPIFAFTKLFQSSWVPAWNYFLKQRLKFEQLLDEQIEARRNEKVNRSDILAMLTQAKDDEGHSLSEGELKDHLITLLFAGHETTQIAIGWAMSWLHRSPEILERLMAELKSSSSLEDSLKSELLDGVCQESLRLNPIVADFLRVFHDPLELEELTLPANSTVAILTCVVHQDPDIYPDPEKFDPDRWTARSYKPFEFLAFGGGIRRCIGATMAIMEMKIALISWLQNYQFKLPDDAPPAEPVHRRNLTMAPSTGIDLIVV